MELQFKVQPYQTRAVEAVVDCFAGQPFQTALNYRLDPGATHTTPSPQLSLDVMELDGFRNADLALSNEQILKNIQQVQRRQNLLVSDSLLDFRDESGKPMPRSYKPGAPLNLDIEMETGTGKTYCYIKSIFELNRCYGWNKFIIVVPSIAIREGVYKSLEITAKHFSQEYHKKARFFIYNSKQLHQLESFSSDAGINVMVINIQAFNASGKDNRRIYDELDDFQSRRPIDVISRNRPILILDEPQKMEGKSTLEALPRFNPLMILRYSATHKTRHMKIHRLDALDAYNQKLVKKISVRGISVKGLAGTNSYLYLEQILISKQAPIAVVEMEVRRSNGVPKRVMKKLKLGDNLYDLSGALDQYRGYVVSQIDANQDKVEFTNGVELISGEALGDVTEETIRRLQIRDTIRAHLEKEKELYPLGIKVLSLFFIDEVAKYRDYRREDQSGEYARIFEEEYRILRDEYLGELALDNAEYRAYLQRDDADRIHNGYFSVDKKERMTDPKVAKRGENAGLSDDVDAYDLILKDKEKLLSFEEPTRFIFSHSALREGWDNPNVFVMCMLKHSDNTISRRQEVGRGLRIAVDRNGERQDNPATVHKINVLDVVTSESYTDFVANLQHEITETLSERPRFATVAYFTGKQIQTEHGMLEVSAEMANQLHRYLIKHDYVDDNDRITEVYHEAVDNGSFAPMPEALQSYQDGLFALIDSIFIQANLPTIDNGRAKKTNPLNANFKKKEFLELWNRINRKAIYQVDFDSDELIRNAVRELDRNLQITPLKYVRQTGVQRDDLTYEQLNAGKGFEIKETTPEEEKQSVHSAVTYDLLGTLCGQTGLTRKTLSQILTGINRNTFAKFRLNPEHFIAECARIINEQKASAVIEQLSYDETSEEHNIDIFTAGEQNQNFAQAIGKLNRHIYDYVITDSKVERDFVTQLDTCTDIIVYAKLPRGFHIPTPVGEYNPDWAISFKDGTVKHVYFIAETKGALSSLQLRGIEKQKIDCARKFFKKLTEKHNSQPVIYDVVDSFDRLLEVVAT